MSDLEIPESFDNLDWILEDPKQGGGSPETADPIVRNMGSQPEPDFFDTNFGAGANNRSESGLGNSLNLIAGGESTGLGGKLAGAAEPDVGGLLTSDGLGEGPLVDSGAPDHVLGGLAGAAGGAEFADGIVGVGNSRASKILSIASAINTFMTYDPVTSGRRTALAERATVTAADLAWGLGGGPPAVIDAATGGNLGGGQKVLAAGIFAGIDALATGNNRSMFNLERSIDKGNYGAAAGFMSNNSPFALYPYGPTIAQQREIDKGGSE